VGESSLSLVLERITFSSVGHVEIIEEESITKNQELT
jgi:hypothetical protein